MSIKRNLASWLLEVSLKLFPVKPPPETRIVYTSHNVCHECLAELVNVSKGVWACPRCVQERIAERLIPIHTMIWYQQHPGAWRKVWLENERQKREEKTIPLLAMPKNISRKH